MTVTLPTDSETEAGPGLSLVLDSAAVAQTTGNWTVPITVHTNDFVAQTGITGHADSRMAIALGSISATGLGLSTWTLGSPGAFTALQTALTGLTTLASQVGGALDTLSDTASDLQTSDLAASASLSTVSADNLAQVTEALSREQLLQRVGMTLLIGNQHTAELAQQILPT
jgi:flagellin-like hook-associated protein FlgL